jgi:hypothetical protein
VPWSSAQLLSALFQCLYALCASTFIFRTRLRIRRESPVWLLALGSWPFAFQVSDFAIARRQAYPEEASWWLSPVLLFGGLALYISKIPERFLPWCDIAGRKIQQLSAGRTVDIFLQSHAIWHFAYTCTWHIYLSEALRCAIAASASAATGGTF